MANRLLGLLDFGRKCPRGHDDMEKLDGEWALQGVVRAAGNGLNTTGLAFVARLYRCRECGTVELVDEEVSRGGA